ncbi:MAG: FHA domain-containing protein [Candidatus Promineifilaceae bacterium]|nr:FHA domain-containing protein [Candidatus Promineifilaceae bacterium]
MPSSMYKLTVRKGPQQGQAYPLVSSMVTIGRDPMADIVIADPEVSRQHARLTRTAEGYEIQDLGSTNGTFVDGQRLTGDPVRLESGQAISMGTNVTLIFEAAADPMATVISSEPELDIPESPAEEEEEKPPAPAEKPEPLPETGPFDEEEEAEPDAEATALEFPSFEEEASLEEEEEGEEVPSFDEPEIPEPAPYEPAPQEQTILDTEPESPAYAHEQAEEEPGELPSFGSEEPAQEAPAERPLTEAQEELPPPPPSPPESTAGDNRNRNIIIAVVVILLLLCCCCILAYGGWIYGDAILQELGLY